ncbi:ThiF family adenylyltransferase [Vibrio owensii]|uniref:ThiF family adenylyltransferase n=1 Tax=Vibrio owensii TaxID=696485 RepID=UPI0038CDD62C
MTYPDWLIHDIRVIGLTPGISNLTHSYFDNYVEVFFDLHYDEYAQVCDDRLTNPEPIKLRYKLSQLAAAPEFLSDRDDFPKTLPHLNPVPEGDNASICLWRKGGNSALYSQRGISACIDTLKDWFEDASVGYLQHDGWEPIPRGGPISFSINLRVWQEAAIKPNLCGKVLSIASTAFIDKLSGIHHLGWIVPKPEFKQKTGKDDFLRPLTFGKPSQIRTYLLVPEMDFVEGEHNSVDLNSFDSLLAYSKHPQLAHTISAIKDGKKRQGISAAVLAIVQRRPIPLIQDIPSLSTNEDASKIEITAVLVVHDSTNGFKFHSLQVKSSVTSDMLANVSGIEPINKDASIIGCGSVGSAVVDYLARSGHKRFSLWDNDILEAHNNARHILHQDYVDRAASFLGFKVKKMKERLEEINPEVSVRARTKLFDEKQLLALKADAHLIDSTGESIEPSWLNQLSVPLSRMFIADQGRLAFLLTQVPQEVIDMLDIEGVIFSHALHDESIRGWLKREAQLSDKMLGLSCSSATMEMPWFKIHSHVSSLMPSLLKQMNTASTSVVMNKLDDDGSPLGLTQFDCAQPEFIFEQALVEDTDGKEWTVTYNHAVLNKITKVRDTYLPDEAAGYLIGLYNIATRRISIVVATKGKFTSSTSEAALESIAFDSDAKNALDRSNYMLKPLGTWHSHPGLSAEPSPKDKQTFGQLLNCRERTAPTVMLIRAKNETRFLVGANRKI